MTDGEVHQLSREIGSLAARMEAASEQDREQFHLIRQMADDVHHLRGDLERHMAVEEARDTQVDERLAALESDAKDFRRLKNKAGGAIAMLMGAAGVLGALGLALLQWALKKWGG